LFGVAIVSLVVLTACSSAIQPDTGTTSAAPDDSVQSDTGTTLAPSSVDHQLPADFPVTVYQGEEILGGTEVNFSEALKDGRPVVLNLWAGLCPPCRLEMPDFEAVHGQFGDEVLLFGLDVGPFTSLGSSEEGQALIQELGVTYPAGTTTDAEVVRAYELIGMPTTYFIKPNGEIHRQWTGLLTEDKLAELIEELIEASGAS
jgi:thiol-disulfide isomerase/thioredoxin